MSEIWQRIIRPRVERTAKRVWPHKEIATPKDKLEAALHDIADYISNPEYPERIRVFHDELALREKLAEYPLLEHYHYDLIYGPTVKPSPYEKKVMDIQANNLSKVLTAIKNNLTDIPNYSHIFETIEEKASTVQSCIKKLHQREQYPFTATQMQREVYTVLHAIHKTGLIEDESKTKLLIAGVPINLAESDEQNKSREDIVNLVAAKVYAEIDERFGSKAYEVIPSEYKKTVDKLIRDNAAVWKDKFKNQEEYVDAMAKNWWAHNSIFNILIKKAGFTEVKQAPDEDRETFNNSLITGLTASSSFVVLGAGAFDDKGQGASFDYRKLPLRAEPELPNESVAKSAKAENLPAVNKRFTVDYTFEDEDIRLRTTPLIAVYRSDDTPQARENLRIFLETITIANKKINELSGFR